MQYAARSAQGYRWHMHASVTGGWRRAVSRRRPLGYPSAMPEIASPLDPTDLPGDAAAGAIADVARVRGLLVASARRREAISYSALLDALGHRFTRPKMRALCKTLDAIDAAGAATGEPELAVLVVRESDGLPGQGWWTGGRPMREGYEGQWTGPAAAAFVRGLQERAFTHWAGSKRREKATASSR